MIFPTFEAMLVMLKHHMILPYFTLGEDELNAMTIQLKKMGVKEDKRRIYKTNGALPDMMIWKLLCWRQQVHLVIMTMPKFALTIRRECLPCWLCWKQWQTGINSHLLKSLESWSFFLCNQAVSNCSSNFSFTCTDIVIRPQLDTYVRLWSMQYTKNGLYTFVREKKIVLSEEFGQCEQPLYALTEFFFTLKVYVVLHWGKKMTSLILII